jgi:hypothetical protein
VLVHARLHAGIGDFVPNYWNDQVAYWHKIASFSVAGFGGGYYSPNEVDFRIPWIPFGVNGPWFPALYGSVGALVGWGNSSSVYFNAVVLALGLVAFVSLTRLAAPLVLLLGVAVLTLWPVLLYVPTSSQESLQQAIGMVLAGIFVRAIARGREASGRERALGVTVLLVASVLRFSWAILLPVLLLLYARRLTPRIVAGALAAGAVVAFAVTKLTDTLQPRGYNSVVDAFATIRDDPVGGSETVLRLARANAHEFFNPGLLDPTSPSLWRWQIETVRVQSWEIVLLVVFFALVPLTALVAPRLRRATELGSIPVREAAFHVVNLGVATIAAIFVYLPMGYYRVLGAHLLVSLLVLIASRRFAAVAVIVALNLVTLPSFLRAYDHWRPNFNRNLSVLRAQREQLGRLIAYDPDAKSRWCNTLLIAIQAHDWRVTLVPPGIGISYAIGAGPKLPLRSRYVLLSRRRFPLNELVVTTPIRELGSVAGVGTVYENPDSDCFR